MKLVKLELRCGNEKIWQFFGLCSALSSKVDM